MDRFGIFLNPLSGNNQRAIIQTVKPISIIKVDDTNSCSYSKTYGSITLGIYFCSEEIPEEKKIKLLDRAFHWYKSYLDYEKGNRERV